MIQIWQVPSECGPSNLVVLAQSDSLNLSFVKDFNIVAQKWPDMVMKWPFMGHIFLLFSYKIEN